MSAYGLTPLQAKVLRFIREYISANGHSPSFKEIGAAIEIKSKSGVHRVVTALRNRGHITMLPGGPRSIAVLRASLSPQKVDA